MKISHNWLKQFIKFEQSTEEISQLLTDLGLEVEAVTPFESVKGSLEGVVVGEVLTCEKHPDADRLKVTTVALGGDVVSQIVCGASNVAAGQKVAVATVGTKLFMNDSELQIKKSKIRGVESHGMICAEDELGLGTSHEGIMVLDETLEPGTALADVFSVEKDYVYEIGLTPNRADAMSHWGVARDLRAGLLQKQQALELITPSVSSFRVDKRTLKIDIDVKDQKLAPRYCGVTLSGIEVKPSPSWLQNRLKAIGLTPKNNVVDVTNYVMHELGQPLHAFDASKISGKVIVKTLEEGTTFVTLDDIERKLSAEDLMICDEKGPLCIAGVFGGKHSGVTENTTQIFLESAYFNPVSVRKTAKRHGLNTDASFRFERGIDPTITDYALKRAAILIQEVAGGEITSDLNDIYPKKIEDHTVLINFDRIFKIIGQEIPRETIKKILVSLDIKVNTVSETGIGLTIPAYRVDVTREIDVVEEILRVYGYNQIQFSEKLNATVARSLRTEDYHIQNIVAQTLNSRGFHEMMANSLGKASTIDNEAEIVQLLNPLSNDLAALRTQMLFGGLEALAYNNNRQQSNLRLFEFGKTYSKKGDNYIETKHLCFWTMGLFQKNSWQQAGVESDFFLGKGIVNLVLQRLNIKTDAPKALENDAVFSEGLVLTANGREIVRFGMVKKSHTKTYDLKKDVFFADFQWDAILESAPHQIVFKEIPKFPEVRRDLALLVNDETAFHQIQQLAIQAAPKYLKQVDLFDVYQGANLPEGKKSYAISLILQDEKQTLTDTQIEKSVASVQKILEEQLQAQLR